MATIDVTPAVLDLKLYAGDSTAVTVTTVDANNAPVSLADRTWAASWRADRASATALTLTVDATNAATGILIVHFSGAQTRQMVTRGAWDLEGTPTGGGDPDTLIQGTVETVRDVTRTP